MGNILFNADAVAMNDVIAYLERVDLLPSRSMHALESGAKVLAAEARRIAPERRIDNPINLKNSIRVGRRKKSARNAIEVGVFYPDAPHAHLVERGHGGPKAAPAHPFLETATENVGDQVTGIITKELLDAFGGLE